MPRVWEKIMEGMLDKGKNMSAVQKSTSESCKKAALKFHLEGRHSAMYWVGKKVRGSILGSNVTELF